MKIKIEVRIPLPEGVTGSYADKQIQLKGPEGEIARELFNPNITIKVNGEVQIGCPKATKRHKRLIQTYAAHVRRAIAGVQAPFEYVLKVCASHFPMTVAVKENKLQVKNFLGEKKMREIEIEHGVDVKVKGDEITVQSPDIEAAGRIASRIELMTRIADLDRRVFQDGIFITKKPGRAA